MRLDMAGSSKTAERVRKTSTAEGLADRLWQIGHTQEATEPKPVVNREKHMRDLASQSLGTNQWGTVKNTDSSAQEQYMAQRIDAATPSNKLSGEEKAYRVARIEQERDRLLNELQGMVGKATEQQINAKRQQIKNLDYIK